MAGHEFSLDPVSVPKVKTRHRRIVTPIPPPGSSAVIRALRRVEPRSMGGTLPVVWDHAEGYQVYDKQGNCWIDFTSTIFVANSGHSNPEIRKAIEKQVRGKLLHNYCFPSEVRLKLAQKLVEISPRNLSKAFLLSTGAEATECALKLTRLYGQRLSPAKHGILCFDGTMHGRTLGAQTMGGNPQLRSWIKHPDPEIHHIPFPWRYGCQWGKASEGHQCGASCFHKSLEALAKQGVDLNSIAGVFIEPYLGWGALFFPKDYVQAVRRWADEHEALVIFDEVQAGFGRTGTWFAFQQFGVKADLVCVGKAISSSLPLSAVLGRKDIMDLPDPGSMSSTHTGNPVCCAAALANIQYMQRVDLIGQSQKRGKVLKRQLLALQKRFPDRILSVEGRGMVYAIILVKPGTTEEDVALADRISEKAMQKGVLFVHTGRGTIKMGPPLVIPESAIVEAIDVLREAMEESLAEPART